MFDSSTFYTTTTCPFSCMDNTPSYVLDDLNPSSKQDDPLYLASICYHLPSPLIYNEIDTYRDLNSAIFTDDTSILQETNTMMGSSKGETIIEALEECEMNKNKVRRVRTSKKDRHSKINTAHGLRDRRMRLSLDVARPFFKLQDMLGYDKASLTIKWLLSQSKEAIDEVLQSKKDSSPSGVTKCIMPNSTSDCEVESIFEVDDENTSKENSKRKKLDSTTNVVKDKSKQMTRNNKPSKELRNEARARARKRTLERSMQNKRLKENGGILVHVDDSLMKNWSCEPQNGGTFQSVPSYKV